VSIEKENNIENIITFVCSMPKMEDAFPEPEPLSKNIPEWYKLQKSYMNNDKTPQDGNQKLTVKKCQAIFDVISMGYTLKSPYDIYIDTSDGEKLKYDLAGKVGPRRPLTGTHGKEQFDEMPIDPDFYVRDLLRLNMIWLIKTQPGYSCLFINPMLSDSSPLMAVPGVIDTDEFYPSGLFSFFVKKNYKGIIKKGTPLLQVIPFKREDYSHEIIKDMDINNKLDEQSFQIRTVFNSGYKSIFWKKKKYK
jgi:hypothetical protein